MSSSQSTAMSFPLEEPTALQPSEGGAPLSAVQLRSRLLVIQDVMRSVMQEGQDYGKIPGTEKPTLFKPGAEKLCVTFRLAAGAPIVESVPEFDPRVVRYRVQVPILNADGSVLAVGVGECSTGEEKYQWRRPVHVREYEAASEFDRREKWTRAGDVWQQVRVNPSDIANTVLKMGHKRAYVHAVIMATAAGAIFTQDLEDLPEGVDPVGSDETPTPPRQPIQPPQRKASARAPQQPARAANGSSFISEAQAKRFWAIAKNNGHADGGKAFLLERGIASDREIPRDQYEALCAEVNASE